MDSGLKLACKIKSVKISLNPARVLSRSESSKFKPGRLDNICLLELNSNFKSLLTEFLKMTEVGVVGGDRGGVAISPLYNSHRLVP